MKQAPFLIVDQLSKTYPTAGGSLTVLKDASFTVEAGESLAIVGPSGSGKTTLLGLCAGLDEPSAGSVTIGGRSLKGLTEDERALFRNAQIGFVFQNFQLIPTLTALENVLVPLELRGGRVKESIGIEWLEKTGLADRRHHYPIQLSGGEQQRIALARAFVHEPKLLFCDEPTGNLDGETANTMVELIFTLVREQQSTLVLVTHDLELANRCDTLLRLKGGQIVGRDRKGTTSQGALAKGYGAEQPTRCGMPANRSERGASGGLQTNDSGPRTNAAQLRPSTDAAGEKT